MISPVDAPLTVSDSLRGVASHSVAGEFGGAGGGLASRLVYMDRRIRVIELRPPIKDSAEPRLDRSNGYHVVLVHRGVAECLTGRACSPTLTIDPANALLLNPGDRFRLARPVAVDTRMTVITLAPELVTRLFDPGSSRRVDVVRRFRAERARLHAATLLRLHRLRRAWYVGEPGTALVETLADLVWAPEDAACAVGPGLTTIHRHRGVVESAKLLLGAAPAAAHRLEAVAGALAISAHHLAHVFRAQVGLSMHRHLLELRLAAALGELLTGDVGLSTLAFDLGFSSHSHFTARFTRFFGATPSAVRRCSVPQGAR